MRLLKGGGGGAQKLKCHARGGYLFFFSNHRAREELVAKEMEALTVSMQVLDEMLDKVAERGSNDPYAVVVLHVFMFAYTYSWR